VTSKALRVEEFGLTLMRHLPGCPWVVQKPRGAGVILMALPLDRPHPSSQTKTPCA